MTPQQKTILAMLRKGPITYRHASGNGVPVLHARISELRKEGYRVDKLMLSGVLPTGKKIQYAEYTLEEPRNYKRGQRKPEQITSREYTCEVGEDVMHEGKRVRVREILEEGIMSRKRDHNESLETYHQNLKNEAKSLKRYLAGRVIWPSKTLGTAVKVILGGKPHYVDQYGHNNVCLV